jgi:hypothetical protein
MLPKCTNIIKRVVGPELDDHVSHFCKNWKFSIMVDESNDQGDNNFLAILLKIFDPQIQCVTTKFLSMPVCNIGTEENLFNAIDSVFRFLFDFKCYFKHEYNTQAYILSFA